MDKTRIIQLESLLRFIPTTDSIISDSSVLTCGCLTSESLFNALYTNQCPTCGKSDVSILAEIAPLRLLYKIVVDMGTTNKHLKEAGRRFSKKSISEEKPTTNTGNDMDLMSLFYKFAKEESEKDEVPAKRYENITNIGNKAIIAHSSSSPPGISPNELINSTYQDYAQSLLILSSPNTSGVHPINIEGPSNSNYNIRRQDRSNQSLFSLSLQSNQGKSPGNTSMFAGFSSNQALHSIPSLSLGKSSEELEYNFSKCFPFYRKHLQYPTQQIKLKLSSLASTFKSNSVIKRTSKFICTSIHSFVDTSGIEITKFVLMTSKRWELYEYIANDSSPKMICCGKLTGEYGKDYDSLSFSSDNSEIIIRNDFGSEVTQYDNETVEERKKRLNQWDQLFCTLSTNYLTISGTRGILRILDISNGGKPLYTYITNFPIRCILISPNESVIACGITARERLSGKEQPFIILHKINSIEDKKGIKFESVDRITITIPYRDPIKIITFSANSNHLLSCSVWESRYLIIRLNSSASDNYRKPRLIWSETSSSRKRSVDNNINNDGSKTKLDNELMMGDEGITDLQFGSFRSNTIITASCSLTTKPPSIIRLGGVSLDGVRGSSTSGPFPLLLSTISGENSSINSRNATNVEDNESSNSNKNKDDDIIKSSDTILKIPEVGSNIHRFAQLPRGDGICYLNKEGHVYLVSTPNFQLHQSSQVKKIVVQLGEVSNAERFTESASIKFSMDGGKVYVVDRKGIFLVFDFTKGVPGQDVDVVKCKLVTV